MKQKKAHIPEIDQTLIMIMDNTDRSEPAERRLRDALNEAENQRLDDVMTWDTIRRGFMTLLALK